MRCPQLSGTNGRRFDLPTNRRWNHWYKPAITIRPPFKHINVNISFMSLHSSSSSFFNISQAQPSQLSFCSLSFFVNILTRETGSSMFVGDHRVCVTPVPIPNTAVKPAPPMILPCGKVGRRRLMTPFRERETGSFLFCTAAVLPHRITLTNRVPQRRGVPRVIGGAFVVNAL